MQNITFAVYRNNGTGEHDMDEKLTRCHSTEELFQLIRNSPQAFFENENQLLQQDNGELFVEYLKIAMEEAGITPKELIVKSSLGKSHIYFLLSGERTPSRDVVIILAIALGLTLEKTQRMLKLAQKGELYPKVRRDAALICCIEQGLSLCDTNDFLASISEEALL